MKKLISMVLVALLLTTAVTVPVYASTSHVNDGDKPVFNGATSENAFGDLLDWNGIVFGDTNNINAVEGSLAVNGTAKNTATGLSVNGGIDGANPASTEDVALLIHDNAIINGYGNVWGQTVIGTNEGNTYNLSNVTPSRPDGWPRGYTVADSTKYFEDAKNTAYDVKNAVEALTVNGSYKVLEDQNIVYQFQGDKDADVLVYNINESNFESYRFDFEIADNQTVVLNFTAPEKIRMDLGAWSINGIDKLQDLPYLKGYNRNIIINIANAQELEMSNCDMYGILLAPDTTLKGKDGYVCGTSIVKSIDCPQGWNGFGLLLGGNSSFIPAIPVPGNDPDEKPAKIVSLKVITPLGMAVRFEDGSVYYSGDSVDVEVGKDYRFQMCCVDWSTRTVNGEKKIHKPDETFYPANTAYLHTNHGTYSDDGLGLRGTVVYTVRLSDKYGDRSFDENTKTFVIPKGDYVLRTDVNKCFMAYRFTFRSGDHNKQTGIDNVVYDTGIEHENTLEDFRYYKPLEFLSVNLPLGSTVTAKAYKNYEYLAQASIFVNIDADNPNRCYKTYVWQY